MYRSLTRLTALLLVALGITMLVVTAWHGGGVGILLGTLFVLAGVGRLWLLRRHS
ncbi:MAG TPA: hypothetical protein VFU56_04065 [Gaiellaceae bacterium]|nr:hypothetical protein [Gaiellaceae bacterium]